MFLLLFLKGWVASVAGRHWHEFVMSVSRVCHTKRVEEKWWVTSETRGNLWLSFEKCVSSGSGSLAAVNGTSLGLFNIWWEQNALCDARLSLKTLPATFQSSSEGVFNNVLRRWMIHCSCLSRKDAAPPTGGRGSRDLSLCLLERNTGWWQRTEKQRKRTDLANPKLVLQISYIMAKQDKATSWHRLLSAQTTTSREISWAVCGQGARLLCHLVVSPAANALLLNYHFIRRAERELRRWPTELH